MKDKITDTWTFKLNTVLQIGFSSLVEESFSSVGRNIVTEKGAKRVLSLRREPRLTPFSLQMNNDKYDITSLVHLPISYT